MRNLVAFLIVLTITSVCLANEAKKQFIKKNTTTGVAFTVGHMAGFQSQGLELEGDLMITGVSPHFNAYRSLQVGPLYYSTFVKDRWIFGPWGEDGSCPSVLGRIKSRREFFILAPKIYEGSHVSIHSGYGIETMEGVLAFQTGIKCHGSWFSVKADMYGVSGEGTMTPLFRLGGQIILCPKSETPITLEAGLFSVDTDSRDKHGYYIRFGGIFK